MSIYVRDAAGNRQKIAGVGLPGPAGKSAYQYAVEGGFSGTEEEFRAVVGVRSNPNLLDNWYFVDPINQRGQIKYTDDRNSGVYSIDRWEVGWLGTIEVHDGFIRIVGGPQKGSAFNLQQKLEQAKKLNGRIVTASIMYSHSHENIWFGLWDQFASLPNTNGNIGVLSTTKIYHEGETFAIMATSENATIDIYAVKLELGPVQTLAHKEGDKWVLNDPPPNKALELAKCQRYFQRLNIIRPKEVGIQWLFADFKTTMHINPTIVNIISDPPNAEITYTASKDSVRFKSDTISYFEVMSFDANADL